MIAKASRVRTVTAVLLTAIVALSAAACGGKSASGQTNAGGAPSTPTSATVPSTTPSTAPSTSPTSPSSAPPTSLPPVNPAALNRVIPEPVSLSAAAGTFPITDAAVIRTSQGAGPVGQDLAAYLQQATGQALAVNGDENPATPGTLLINLELTGADAVVGDEGYQLDVAPTGVDVRAKTTTGLFHAVQTIRQLLTPGPPATLPAGHVTDYPRYGYRGGMLDVARHFFTVADVEKYIDTLALYKINYFHLHLTDDQGWRLAVPGWPKLTSVGGSTQVGGGAGGFYTADDYKAIVAYAASRFMTLIPEVDMPGHVSAAVASYPELACDGRKHTLVTAVSPPFNALCTSSESVYGFVDNVVATLAALTPGPYVGIGGDEANSLTKDQYAGFVDRAQAIVAKHGKTVYGWAEMANAKLLPGTVSTYWNTGEPQPFVASAAAAGSKIVMAPASHTYLDQKYDANTKLGLQWAGYIPVQKAYDWDPVTVLSGVPPTSVLGVEAPLWTETVHSLQDAETLAFPRLTAIAEIGWSPPKTHDWTSYAARLGKQAPLWQKLGISFYRAPEIAWT